MDVQNYMHKPKQRIKFIAKATSAHAIKRLGTIYPSVHL
jgi:hypothetical protein